MATKTRKVSAETFLRRVKSLYGTVRADIREALRKVDNKPEKLPEELWKEIEDKERRVLLYLLMGFSIAAFDDAFGFLDDEYPGDIDYDTARGELETALYGRADWTAGKITETTRNRLLSGMERRGEDDSVDSVLDGVLSPARVDTLVRTEMRAATNIPNNVLTTLSTANDVYLVWKLGPTERHCPLCPLLHGTDREFWGRWVPAGPPTPHIGCLCRTEIVIGDYDWLRETGQLLPYPTARQVRDAMRLLGVPMESREDFGFSFQRS